ncbi:serine/threonine-protein kinase, partial [Actinoplanes sp. NPDC051633]|uniref:serine/threonine-protein kinase n=1 Tax=Actinoplanes sp. NPDC051633 TaxID=3155670 RepID=UPI0034484F0B
MLQAGTRLGGRYRLEERVGAGGMGEVWRAVDEVLGRTVAVKAMLPHVADQQDFARRFVTEAQAMAGVADRAVASIHDYGRDAGVTFLVMEFIDGESMARALARAGRFRAADTMRMIAQAADGLRAVHDAGIVHRDVKPANLMIRRGGAVVLTDFGISRAGDATSMTVSGAVLGTPTYLSPEQVMGHPATPLSDLYALGVAAYECLAGRKPFAGDNPYAVAVQRVQGPPPPLPDDVPRAAAAVVERAMAQDPARRWPSA